MHKDLFTSSEGGQPTATATPHGNSLFTYPMGLHLIPLAFVDDLRNHPKIPTELIKAPDPLIKSMSNLISVLSMSKGYDPQRYPNPQIHQFYEILQAAIFEENKENENSNLINNNNNNNNINQNDPTLPKYKSIQKRAFSHIENWNSMLESYSLAFLQQNQQQTKTKTKPGSSSSSSQTSKKRTRKDEDNDNGNDNDDNDENSILPPKKKSTTTKGNGLPTSLEYAVKNSHLGKESPDYSKILDEYHKNKYSPQEWYREFKISELRGFTETAGIRSSAATKMGLGSIIIKYFDALKNLNKL